MRLRIVTPLSIMVDEDITSLRAEDASGSFGILSGHAPFLTALAVSIVSWRQGEVERFCALRGGTLAVMAEPQQAGSAVTITTREAVIGDDLATLDADVLARFRADVEIERAEHLETVQLQLNAIRHMVSRLQRKSATTQEFRS